jgi:hypothetical protein
MSIIDFIKGLMGKTTSQVAEKKETAPKEQKPSAQPETSEKAPEKPAFVAADEAYSYSDKLTIGDKMYKLSGEVLSESTDGGKTWEMVTEFPMYYTFGLTTDDNGELAIIGQYHNENILKELRDSAIQIAAAFTGEKGYNKVAELLENMKEWSRQPRAFKYVDGELYVDFKKGSLSNFVHFPSDNREMTLCADALEFDEKIKTELKAMGQKKAETVKVLIRYYLQGQEVMISLDGKRWYCHEVDLPKDFRGFEYYKGILVAKGKEDKKYFYYRQEWNLIDFEADLEICEADVEDKVYKMLNGKENTYLYDNDQEAKTKMVHLLIMAGKKGFFNDAASIYYIANDHVRHDVFNHGVEMDEISNVKELYGEVFISGEVNKKIITQIFTSGSWNKCGAFNSDDDEGEANVFEGPFCFETYILEDDPFWDCVDSPIKEYQMDAKKKESFKARKMIVKVPKQSRYHILYLDKNGSWKLHSDLRIDYQRLYNTGEPEPIWDKKHTEILYYVYYPMTFYNLNGTKGHQWTRKKKGLFTKQIVYEWDDVNPVDREMMNKVKVK